MSNYSVLMSVYYKEKPEYLKISIESMLNQTVQTDDFVLVCDGPLTPELDAVVNRFQESYSDIFHVVRLDKNAGLGPALNEGLKHCKNELVARMDSDDYALKERCALQLDAFDRDPQLSIVSGTIQEFETTPDNVTFTKRMPQTHEEILRYAKLRCPFNHPAVMYKKSAVLDAGGYPDLPLHEDYALWVNMLIKGKRSINLANVLCLMRVDNGMYKRRGGVRYYKTAVRFRRYLLKHRFCNLGEFLYGVLGLTVVCLLPASVRKKIYIRFLRTNQ